VMALFAFGNFLTALLGLLVYINRKTRRVKKPLISQKEVLETT